METKKIKKLIKLLVEIKKEEEEKKNKSSIMSYIYPTYEQGKYNNIIVTTESLIIELTSKLY